MVTGFPLTLGDTKPSKLKKVYDLADNVDTWEKIAKACSAAQSLAAGAAKGTAKSALAFTAVKEGCSAAIDDKVCSTRDILDSFFGAAWKTRGYSVWVIIETRTCESVCWDKWYEVPVAALIGIYTKGKPTPGLNEVGKWSKWHEHEFLCKGRGNYDTVNAAGTWLTGEGPTTSDIAWCIHLSIRTLEDERERACR